MAADRAGGPMTERQVVVHETPAALYEDAARRFVNAASAAVAARERCFVALSGGSTPRALYQLLAAPGWRARVPWPHLHVFWGDERLVPHEDPRSNYGMARTALLSRIAIPSDHVRPVPTDTDAGAPERVAALYEELIRRIVPGGPSATPAFDLVLLGLGEDGHTASLFPHSPALRVVDRLVAAVILEEPGMPRITMTVPLLNAARLQLFLVAGVSKAAVLREVLSDRYDPERLPAQLLRPGDGSQLWLVDRAACGAQAAGG